MTSKCDKPNCPHRAVWLILTGTGERFCSCGHDLHHMLRTVGVQHGRMVAILPCEVTPERTKPQIVKATDLKPIGFTQTGNMVFHLPEEADNA